MQPNSNIPKVPENPSDEHDFHVLGSRRFEHLVRALHEAQPDIFATHLYGPDGQTQFGADHVAYHRSHPAPFLEVGQSKACRRFVAGDLRKAAKEFTDHWETHWRGKDVRRFILFVACAIKSQSAHDEIVKLTRSFAGLGVEFAVWDANAIYDRLGAAPGVVRGHLGQGWYSKLFGEPVGPLTGLQRDLQKGDKGAFVVGGFVARLNQAEAAEITELRRRARRGEVGEVIEHLELMLFGSPAAGATAPEVRAQQLRLLAGLLINRREFVRAKALLDEADGLDGESRRLRGILLLETVGPEAALADIEAGAEARLAEIRAIARLRLGDPVGAYEELAAHVAEDNTTAETLRIAALARLVAGDRETALGLAERAVARDPDARACVQAVALTHFHLALSAAAEVSTGEWPQPVDQPLVGSSDAAREHLERAEKLFAGLAEDASLDDHRSMVMWNFATLACMSWRRADAEARVRTLQEAGLLPIPLIAWCVSRGLPFDQAAAAAACDSRLEQEPSDFETLLIRVALANSQGDHTLARRLLSSHRESLVSAGHESLYDYWSTVLDMETHGRPSAAVVQAHPWLRLRLALDIGRKKERLEAIGQLLEQELDRDGDPRVILASAQLLLDGGCNETAAKATTYLLERVATGEATGVAAHALYRNGRWREVLSALERSDAFPGGRLPADLERLKTECLAHSGELVAAREASRTLAQSTGRARDIWRSIEFHLATGAEPAALALYEQHAEQLAKPSPGHVLLARAVLQSHPDAAARITRQLATATPDALVTAAYTLASKLRLEAEQRTLVGRIQQLGSAGRGGVQTLGFDEVIAWMKRHQEEVGQAFEKYANGHWPVHALSAFREAALPLAYLGPLLDPPSPNVRTAILSTRYGRRYSEAVWPDDRVNVVLLADLTALLTAHGLDLLDVTERAFKPVYIAPDTLNALLAIRSDVEVIQPERAAAAARVVAHANAMRLSPHDGTSEIDAFAVLWELDGAEEDSALNFSRLIEIVSAGRPAGEQDAFRATLGTTLDPAPAGATPPPGSILNLDGAMANTLEAAGLLAAVMARFRVVLPAEDIERLRADVQNGDTRQQIATALLALSARIGMGLEDGTYKTVPVSHSQEQNVVRRCFMQLLEAMADSKALFWVDDRFVSSVDDAQFTAVTTVEVLGALRRYGRLSRAREIEYRQRLRAARWQFLPIDGDEIVQLLRSATRAGVVNEDDELSTLRRAMGEMLRERRRLQWPDPASAERKIRGEVPYLLDASHAITVALGAIWNDLSWSLDDAAAASSWIVDHIEIGLFPLPILGAGDPRSDQLIGTHLGSLILVALQVHPGNVGDPRQAAYLEWLMNHIVRSGLRMRPEFRPAMETMVEEHFVREDGVRAPRLWLALAANILNTMPEDLRLVMLRRPGIREGFGLPEHGQIAVGGYDFDELTFLTAITAAKVDEATWLKARTGEIGEVRLVDGENRYISLAIGGQLFRLDAWDWEVANDDPAIRRAALEAHAFHLDLSEAALGALADELGPLSRPERIRRTLHQEHASAARWYIDLNDRVQHRAAFKLADLMLEDIGQIARLLRLDDSIDAAASALVAERGLVVALRRFGGLPIEPPRAIGDAIEAMDDGELNAFLAEAEADTSPPWVQLLLARILVSRPNGAGAVEPRIRGWIDRALSDRAMPYWRLYVALAQFACSEGPTTLTWRRLGACQQLAACWLHASSVAEIVIGDHVELEGFTQWVESNRFVPPRLLVEPLAAFTNDRADPRRTNVHRIRAYAAAPVLAAFAEDEQRRPWAHGHVGHA